jgi:hypothetical protein
VRLLLNVGSRTLESDLSTQIDLFQVTFSDAYGSEVNVESSDTVIDASLPSMGNWDINVTGYNDGGIEVAAGSESINIDSSTQQSVAIVMRSIDGDGDTLLQLEWNPVQIQNASVTAELIDTNGQSTPLTFSITSAGNAECSLQLASGFYTLQAQLRDNDTVVAGIAEAVQILTSGTTAKVFSFDTVNKPGEMLTVSGSSFTVAWNPPSDPSTGDPIPVSGYRLYYREHGTYQWTQLIELTAGVTEYTIDSTILPAGDYEFAVSALYVDTESELHTSYDDTADPTYGWYIAWSY